VAATAAPASGLEEALRSGAKDLKADGAGAPAPAPELDFRQQVTARARAIHQQLTLRYICLQLLIFNKTKLKTVDTGVPRLC
jgi:hypothetical protein